MADTPAQCDKKHLSIKKQAMIVKALAAGHPVHEIEQTLHTSTAIIHDLSELHSASIEQQRKKLAGRLVSLAPQVLARIESQIKDKSFVTPTKDLAITAGIILDKYERMTGQPSQIIQVTHSDPGRAEYEAWLQCKTINIDPNSIQSSACSYSAPAPVAGDTDRGGGVPSVLSASEVVETTPIQKNDNKGQLPK